MSGAMNQEAILALEAGLPGEPVPRRPTVEESRRWLQQQVWSLPVLDERSAEAEAWSSTSQWTREAGGDRPGANPGVSRSAGDAHCGHIEARAPERCLSVSAPCLEELQHEARR
jgi:hypothetical protein